MKTKLAQMMNVSEFFENEIPPFLLGAFYGRTEQDNNGNFYTYSGYRNGKIFDNQTLYNRSKVEYKKQLNTICSTFPYWQFGEDCACQGKIVAFVLKNDLQLSRTSFFNRLNTKIYSSSFLYKDGLTTAKKMFIRGFMELRASIDRNRNLITIDYISNNTQETKRLRLLIDYLGLPPEFANFIFRECQPQYFNGINKRENQFRINAFWYGKSIGLINIYKAAAFKACIKNNGYKIKNGITYFDCTIPLSTNTTTFESRLNYYAQNIEGHNLTEEDIRKFKDFIGITEATNDTFQRNPTIVQYIRYFTKDECACCKDKYKISDRTCLLRNTKDRYYLEIHHVISVGHEKQLDDIDNLVKVCPACHATLKRGRADETTQKGLIECILNNKKQVRDFCESYFDSTDFNTVVEQVWEHLN